MSVALSVTRSRFYVLLDKTSNRSYVVLPCMCQYCAYSFSEGWTALLKYDELYQKTMRADSASTHGFHESWDELRGELEV